MLVLKKKKPRTHTQISAAGGAHVLGAFPIYEDVISRRPLLTQVLERVRSFRSSLVYLHVAANEMEPTSRSAAQREADEKVRLLRRRRRAFVGVKRWQRISGAALKVRREATHSKSFNCKI